MSSLALVVVGHLKIRRPEGPSALDVIVVGGGQAGHATAYYLRKAALRYLVLDASPAPGGSWPQRWDGLRLFSPASASSLPGMMMPPSEDAYPARDHVVDYLSRYEARYGLPIERPVEVTEVVRSSAGFEVRARGGRAWQARTVVSATGGAPHRPEIEGQEVFTGEELHSADYREPRAFVGRAVLIVGGGNSAAQILAEVSEVADATWVAAEEPTFMADDVDGRALFALATRRRQAQERGEPPPAAGDLGSIVMVPSVKDARRRGVLRHEPMIERLTARGARWPDGREQDFDAVIWCTGFRPRLDHLAPLDLASGSTFPTADTRSQRDPRVWLVGYGDWTGFASATLIGVGRTAKQTVGEIKETLARDSVS